jgi:nucleotide-binding universal stress UspA family protein
MAEVEHLLEPMPALVKEQPRLAGNISIDAARLKAGAEATYRLHQMFGERIVAKAAQVAHDRGVSDVETHVEEGEPAARILACAEREQADLIVVGSRGMSDLKGLLMGSVSHKVSQLAPCTCITVRG